MPKKQAFHTSHIDRSGESHACFDCILGKYDLPCFRKTICLFEKTICLKQEFKQEKRQNCHILPFSKVYILHPVQPLTSHPAHAYIRSYMMAFSLALNAYSLSRVSIRFHALYGVLLYTLPDFRSFINVLLIACDSV